MMLEIKGLMSLSRERNHVPGIPNTRGMELNKTFQSSFCNAIISCVKTKTYVDFLNLYNRNLRQF